MRAVDSVTKETSTVQTVGGILQVQIVGGDAVAWDDITGKPAVIAAGATQAEARTAIGAGTSNLTIGTTASTAKAGNYVPAWSDVTGKPTTFAPIVATASVVGGVKQGVAVTNATDAATVVTQLNALLAALRTAGVIAS